MTCYFGDALQSGNWKSDNHALGGAHPQQALANQQTCDLHALGTCNRKGEKRYTHKKLVLLGVSDAKRLTSLFKEEQNKTKMTIESPVSFPSITHVLVKTTKNTWKLYHLKDLES